MHFQFHEFEQAQLLELSWLLLQHRVNSMRFLPHLESSLECQKFYTILKSLPRLSAIDIMIQFC